MEEKELKELIISIVILILIFTGNAITEKNTENSVSETVRSLNELRDEIKKKDSEIDSKVANKKIDDIHKEWDSNYDTLAYYIEHDELEKVETEMTALRSYIEKDEYTEALPELDKAVFIINHIKAKTAIDLKNIFQYYYKVYFKEDL